MYELQMGFRTAPYTKIKYTVQRFSFMLPNVHFSGCHRSFVITSGVMSKWTLFKGSWGSDMAPISHDSTASVWCPDPWSSGFDVAAVLSLHTHTPRAVERSLFAFRQVGFPQFTHCPHTPNSDTCGTSQLLEVDVIYDRIIFSLWSH